MKTTDFAQHLSAYLTIYLPGQAGLSQNTILSYRDTFKLVLLFAESERQLKPEKMRLEDFTADFITDFLQWLESERGCSIATRNQRLTALRAFAKYVRSKAPEYLLETQKISDLRAKKKPKPMVAHLPADLLRAIIAKTNLTDRYGRRDMALLCLMYDSAARVQEVCDLRVRDLRLQKPFTVILSGKESKTRAVPIMASTAEVLVNYIEENRLNAPEKSDYPLFFNHQHTKLTRAGVTYILKKYCDAARKDDPLIPQRMSPHVFRHSKAMHMLQSGINLVYIRDFLGHEHVDTTEVYAKADTETKRNAIESAQIRIEPELSDWAKDKPLMNLLTNICGKE